MREKKFLWGLLVGAGYFMLLLAISLILHAGKAPEVAELLAAAVLTMPAGMVGGMLS